MKKIIACFLILTSLGALAQKLNMKPGLWNVEMTVQGADGKKINPAAAMEEAMAKIPKAQREQMMKMMGKMEMPKMNKKGMEICYTEQMLNDPGSIAKHEDQDCTSKFVSKTATEVKTTFKCKDGTTGNATWKVLNDSNYEGEVHVNSPENGKSKILYKGTFISKKCKN